MNKGSVKIGIKTLKNAGVHLPLLVAASSCKKDEASPSILTKKMKGEVTKTELSATHRGLKALTKKGLIAKEDCYNYHTVPCQEEDFVTIPACCAVLEANVLRVYACLIYAFERKTAISPFKVRKLTGVQLEVKPILDEISKLPSFYGIANSNLVSLVVEKGQTVNFNTPLYKTFEDEIIEMAKLGFYDWDTLEKAVEIYKFYTRERFYKHSFNYYCDLAVAANGKTYVTKNTEEYATSKAEEYKTQCLAEREINNARKYFSSDIIVEAMENNVKMYQEESLFFHCKMLTLGWIDTLKSQEIIIDRLTRAYKQ